VARTLADTSLRTLAVPAQNGRDTVRLSRAHPAIAAAAVRRPNGARDEFLLAATAQNIGKLAKLRPMVVPA